MSQRIREDDCHYKEVVLKLFILTENSKFYKYSFSFPQFPGREPTTLWVSTQDSTRVGQEAEGEREM